MKKSRYSLLTSNPPTVSINLVLVVFFKKVLEIDSNHHVANHSYGKLLLKLNQHIKGLKLIEKVSGIIRFKKDILKII